MFIIANVLIIILIGNLEGYEEYLREYKENLVTKVINHSFKNTRVCCLLDNNSSEANLLSNSLIGTNYTYVIKSSDKIGTAGNCSGVILAVRNTTKLLEILADKSETYLKPHQRFLVICFGQNCNIDKVKWNLYERAIALLLLKLEERKSDKHLLIKEPVLNATLMTFSRSVHLKKSTNLTHYLKRAPKWNPKEMLTRTNKSFTISISHCPPFVMINDSFTGIEYEVIKQIVKDWPVKFQVTTYAQAKLFPISLTEQLLKSKTVDLVLCGFWQSMVLSMEADMTGYLLNMCFTFLVPKAQRKPDSTFLFQPFSSEVWIVCHVVWIICAIMSYFAIWFHRRVLHRKDKYLMMRHTLLAISLSFIRVISMSSLARVPPQNLPVLRRLFIWYVTYSVLVATYYSAGITTSLSIPKLTKEIKTLEGMIQDKLIWKEPSFFIQNWLLNNNVALYNNIAARFQLSEHINRTSLAPNEAVYVRVLPEKYVAGSEALPKSARNRLKLLKECWASYKTVMVLQKDSPYTRTFDRAIMKYREHGLTAYWSRYFANQPEVSYMKNFFHSTTIEKYQKVTLAKFSSAFIVLGFGYGLALLAFCWEKFKDGKRRNIKAKLHNHRLFSN